jgi:hypothetical protein
MRNAIVPAKVRKGKPVIRIYDSGQYLTAISGVRNVYQKLVQELGRTNDPDL